MKNWERDRNEKICSGMSKWKMEETEENEWKRNEGSYGKALSWKWATCWISGSICKTLFLPLKCQAQTMVASCTSHK